MANRLKIKVSRADYERLEPHLRGAHTMFAWFKTNPPEDDFWMAYAIEKERQNPRCLLLQRLLGHAQKLERHRELSHHGCPSC